MTQTKYSKAQRLIHWLTLLLLIGSFVSHEAMVALYDRVITAGGETIEMTTGGQAHVVLGLAVLVLTLLRLVLRFVQGVPAPQAGQSAMVTLASAMVHGALYVLLVAMPLTGMMAWGGGIQAAGAVHGVLFNLLFVLVGGHAAAALVHQFVIRDNLLARMR